ncbi:MAG: hypothetical protein JO199_07510 [Candidatus Eremiobacteraeota bacterium]|nr:hypothetical protein [Candidatus Eremiobacteraeota bacterium]
MNRARALACCFSIFFVATLATAAATRADDNWLLGKWQASNGVSLEFTDTTYTMTGPGGSVGPYKCTYAVNGNTVTVTPTEGDDKTPIAVKMVDAKHATMPFDTDTVTLTKQ